MNTAKKDNLIMAIFFYAVAFFFMFSTSGFAEESTKFPQATALILIGLTTLLLFQTFTGKIPASKKKEDVDKKKYGMAAMLSIAYVALVNIVGYVIITPIFLFSLMTCLGYKNKKVAAIVSIVTVALIFLGFKVALHVPIPEGIFLG
ncbi:MAG: tripartite tricarboxylate transporter TctB family protein [Aminobacterium sp.]|uniref:tripartite tricarboxylate transporter TctB family protein n=1 Tax=Aminobacterium sp. TaxID=1872491 RepID=UPI001BD004DE|nr:tripartite tricarboxylate transporter TctB family protein [Aminobacterium sp.]MEA4877892.1 tripartite tricarboxylate transporter TctB family protein [Aminobacterium sp.]